LEISLATHQQWYTPGAPVTITLTEINGSAHPVVLAPTGTFSVTNAKTGSTVFSEASDLTASPVTLEPGQWLIRTATWIPSRTGTYQFTYQDGQVGELRPNQFTVTYTPANQPTLPISLDLTTNRPQYREGQYVVLSLTVTNTSAYAVTLTPNLDDGFSVRSLSRVVWHASEGSMRGLTQSIAPGKSITLHLVWNGKANQPGIKMLSPGSYTLEATLAGNTATTTIQIIS
jgi:hypothetical protein